MTSDVNSNAVGGGIRAEIDMLRDLSRVKARLEKQESETNEKNTPLPQKIARRPTLDDLNSSGTNSSNLSCNRDTINHEEKVNCRDNVEEDYVDSQAISLTSPHSNISLSSESHTNESHDRSTFPSSLDLCESGNSSSDEEYVTNFITTQPMPKPRKSFQTNSSVLNYGSSQKDTIYSTTPSTSSSKISSDSSIRLESWFIDEESINMFDGIPTMHPHYELMSVSKELYMRERAYVNNLKTLLMIRQSLESAGYSLPMFKDLECLCGFHEVLLKEMRTICSGHDNYGNIYRAFLGNFINFLNIYKGCIHTLQDGLNAYSANRDRDVKFVEIIHNHVAGKEDISLISRIPRHITFYPILLQRVVELLPEDSESRADAEKALKQVTEIVKQTNEHVANMVMSVQKCRIISKLGSVTTVPSDASVFIKKGLVNKLSKRTDSRLCKRKLYLFSDILYIKGGNKVKREIPITAMRGLTKLDLLPDKDRRYSFRFRILADKGSVDLVFASENEMNEWKVAISQTISGAGNISNSSGDIPADWRKDEETTMCMHCSKEFSLIIRRHHCRACGHVICSSCSLYTDNNKRESRMCLTCYQEKFPDEYNKLSEKHKKRASQYERKSSLTKTDFFIGVTYERFDHDRRTKNGKYFCFVNRSGKLSFYAKPLDLQPKFVVDGTNQKVFLCPAVISRTSDNARMETNCVAIYDSSTSTLHLLTIEEIQKKKEFIDLLQQSSFNCEASMP